MNLIIAGDLVPTKVNEDLFIDSKIVELLGRDLLKIWEESDARIFNLEVPLVDVKSPINKFGPNLSASTHTINGIKSLNPTLVTLANNHILDQGEGGLNSTINLLSKFKIPYIGVGKSIQESYKPYIIEKDGLRIGVYACAEREFSIATKNTSGANPFDPFESLDYIEKMKNENDYVIVLYHGGKEHYRYPSPYLQKACRKMVEKGADLVVCQHSHCIGSYEKYKYGQIIYGQGNFIFNKHDNEYWNTSLLIRINIDDSLNIEYIPIKKSDRGISIMNEIEAEHTIQEFFSRSENILREGFIEENYLKFVDGKIDDYLRKLLGFGKWVSRIDKFILDGKISKILYSRKKLLAIQNYVECEAHRELLIAGIKKNAGEKDEFK